MSSKIKQGINTSFGGNTEIAASVVDSCKNFMNLQGGHGELVIFSTKFGAFQLNFIDRLRDFVYTYIKVRVFILQTHFHVRGKKQLENSFICIGHIMYRRNESTGRYL